MPTNSAADQEKQHGENQAAIIRLGGRVDNIEKSITVIGDDISKLVSKFDTRSQTNWSVLIAIAGVVLTGAYFIYSNQAGSAREMQASLMSTMKEIQAADSKAAEKLESTVERVNGRFENFVTARALDDRFKSTADLAAKDNEKIQRGVDDVAKDVDAMKANIRQNAREGTLADAKVEIDALKRGVVTRQEHEEHWRSDSKQFDNVQKQIDRNTADLHEMYSAKDAIQQLLSWKNSVESSRLTGK